MEENENVRLQGLKGTWYIIDNYRDTFYLWESEQYGEDWPHVLTDDKLTVLDSNCYEGLDQALIDNNLI